jgi:hypothetical protein
MMLEIARCFLAWHTDAEVVGRGGKNRQGGIKEDWDAFANGRKGFKRGATLFLFLPCCFHELGRHRYRNQLGEPHRK